MAMNDIEILMEFLKIPLDSADWVFDKFAVLPGAIHRGEGLEQFLYIEGDRENKVLLVAHADTYWDHHYDRPYWNKTRIIEKNGIIRNEDGRLGADDRAGCAMIWLLKKIGTVEFKEYVNKITGYSEPDRSSYTDIVTLCHNICGVNLSIGYRNEHSTDEYLVVDEWLNTLNICRKWLSESELPRFSLNAKNT